MIWKGVEKKGQITLFVIVALIIIVLGASYFIFKDTLFTEKISPNLQPVETHFLNCIDSKTKTGIKILQTQGGYIEPPPFVSGSNYMPFSSELNFFGARIPYWHTISGNNVPINQIPSKENMQNQLSEYIKNQIESCNFNSFLEEDYEINKGIPKVEVSVNDNYVRVFVDMNLNIQKGNESLLLTDHQVEVDSKLGTLYKDAVQFYNLEKKDMFLENYSIDFLRLYAPVDGFELSCSPKIWNANQIFSEVKNATRDNFLAMKNFGDKDDYFNLNLPIKSEIRIINFEHWPSTYEVEPADSPILIAKPIGNEPGLGILGFCYVPYHFVYDMKYPLLIQLTQNGETFQFPLPIIIENNVALRGVSETIFEERVDLCEKSAKSNLTIEIKDSHLNPIEGKISYQCFDSTCEIGGTKNGKLIGNFPQCVNGIIIVKSDGYKESSEIFSTVNEGSITMIMDKIYEKTISVDLSNSNSKEKSIIIFSSKDSQESYTLIYPENKKVNLSEGNYNIRVYVHDNSSLKFEASTMEQCHNVPAGIGGIFGITRKECNTINIPEQDISDVLVAGGQKEIYFSESDLSSNKVLEISVERYNNPSSIQELQIIYSLAEAKELGVRFV
ncbi:hypothetical protein COU58_04440 [Candidatus Pacearchaeota archaeon CG10_big_fil_rev_8_21_14_0_10_32_42]|nr:MAG: hypothetical protein COU58_04440 [Candidatus Pacearchaeota archaeon CG10_big_fil_rev_8_21_14_0_10_32_42]